MTDILREVSSLFDNLAMSRIPHYLIPLSLVQKVLTSANAGPASTIQTHLAPFLGSAIPIYVDPEAVDLARFQVAVTQAEIIGNRWLVNTPA